MIRHLILDLSHQLRRIAVVRRVARWILSDAEPRSSTGVRDDAELARARYVLGRDRERT